MISLAFTFCIHSKKSTLLIVPVMIAEMISQANQFDIIKEWILLPFFIFVMAKNILHRNEMISSNLVVLITVSLVITMLAVLVLVPILLLLIVYKKMIGAILKLEDPQFHSMMSSADTVWCVDDDVNGTINILMILASNASGSEVFAIFKEIFAKAWREHCKIRCTREKRYGYFYWRKQHIYEERNYMTKYDDYESIDDLDRFLDQAANAPMPFENKGIFHMIFGVKELKWKTHQQDGIYQYPVLVKFHHSIGDGASAVSFMTSQFCLGSIEDVKRYLGEFSLNIMKKQSRHLIKTSVTEKVKRLAKADFKFVAMADSFDKLALPTQKLQKNCYLTYFSDQNQRISNKIDLIRKNHGLSFTKLILALVEESIAQLCSQKKIDHSDEASYILTCLTAMLNSLQISDNISLTDDGHPIANLTNSFSMGLYKNSIKAPIPSDTDSVQFTKLFLKKFHRLAEELDLLNKSVDFEFINWMIKFGCSSMPAWVISQLLKLHGNPFAITNLPGLPEKQHFIYPNSHIHIAVVDLLYWIPQYKTTGLGLMITKYCGDLKLALISNTAYIKKKEDAELFIENILKNIDTLYEAIE